MQVFLYFRELIAYLALAVNTRISLFFILFLSSYICASKNVENMLLPMSLYNTVNITSKVFYGDELHLDHFHSVLILGSYMLVGARNTIYNISLKTFQESNRLMWIPEAADVEKCLRRQQNQDDCQNYMRVLARKEDGNLLVCGTNAFRPLCRTYQLTSKGSKINVLSEDSGIGRAPFSVSQNSTSLFINERLYTATVGDSSGRETLIYSKPLRTEQYDSQILNEPQFVRSFANDDHAYFLFRETAVENINCGKAIFSRIGRVCLDDPGGDRVLRNSWTTFSKVRLNCSLPGEYPFHFDEIQSSSELGEGSVFSTILSKERTPLFYAVFNTPRNSMGGSAICAFQMNDIKKSFEGPYKEQKTPQSNWLPVKEPPQPHPASTCPSRANFFSDQALNFIKSHPLMDRPVPSIPNRPILVLPEFSYAITSIAVDWQVLGADHRHYDVLFIATDEGRVIKTYNVGKEKNIEMVIVEVLNVFHDQNRNAETYNDLNEDVEQENNHNKRHIDHRIDLNEHVREMSNIGDDVYTDRKRKRGVTNASSADDGYRIIKEMKIYRRPKGKHKKLLIVSPVELRSVPLQRCHYKLTCRECVALRDPYCSWANEKCSATNSGLQNLETGLHPLCKQIKSETQITPLPSPPPINIPSIVPNCPAAEPCNCQVDEVKFNDHLSSDVYVNSNNARNAAETKQHLHLDVNDLPKSHSIFECKDCSGAAVTDNHYVISVFIFLLLAAFGLGFGVGYFYSSRVSRCDKEVVEARIMRHVAQKKENLYHEKKDNLYQVPEKKASALLADDAAEDAGEDNRKFSISQNSTLETPTRGTLPPKYDCTVMIVS